MMFGRFIAYECLFSLVILTFCVFFQSNAVMLFSEFYYPIACMTGVHFIFGAFFMAKLFALEEIGQRLAERFSSIRCGILSWKGAEFESLSAKELNDLGLLVGHFEVQSPLRPMDIFNLNRSSSASVAGLVITYMIILLQMKLGEGRPPNSLTASSWVDLG